MALRPIYVVEKDNLNIKTIDIEFKWYPGMAKIQKQKSIESLHKTAKDQGIKNILEISSKSKEDIGVQLSAFNLSFKTKKDIIVSVESAFQGSKVFEKGGPYNDLLTKSSKEAKKDDRLKNSGNLKYFQLLNNKFPLEPKTFFYDWVYINTLLQPNNKNIAEKIMRYEAFTDIEFNPKKSINCQAFSAALYILLQYSGLLEDAMSSKESFLKITKKIYEKKSENTLIRPRLL